MEFTQIVWLLIISIVLQKKGRKKKDFNISEMDEWMNSSEEDEESGEEEKDQDQKDADKKKKKNNLKDKKKKKKKGSDDEAVEESDDGDEEGREHEYISDSSSSESEHGETKQLKVIKRLTLVDIPLIIFHSGCCRGRCTSQAAHLRRRLGGGKEG
jgi:Transcription initiation factor IIF, alpha subunit (TFIIF-alpha)